MNQKQKSILIIDDSSSIRALVRLILEKENYKIEDAENGAVGINKFEENNFDLIITDIYMPLFTGLEVVIKLKEKNPETKIIVFSDGGKVDFKNDAALCEALGASLFISKANIKNELLPAVHKLLED